MATTEVAAKKGSLEDLIPANLTLVFTGKNSVKRDNKLIVGGVDDEVGTFDSDGLGAYSNSATFVPATTIQGVEVIAISSDGSHEVLTMWPAVAIPNGTIITAAALFNEGGNDDSKSVDDASGKAINYFKYTFTHA